MYIFFNVPHLPDGEDDPHGGPAEDVAHVHGEAGEEAGHAVLAAAGLYLVDVRAEAAVILACSLIVSLRHLLMSPVLATLCWSSESLDGDVITKLLIGKVRAGLLE